MHRRLLRFVPALVIAIIGLSTEMHAAAQQSGTWYYCDASKTYYPYATTCPEPWRQVTPFSSTATPATGQPAPIQGSEPHPDPPAFCNKPGWGLSTSGLTLNQRRQCYDAIHAIMHEPVGNPADRAQEDAAARSSTAPSYCKPGYGLIGSGVTQEQMRICEATDIPEVERIGRCEGSPGACKEAQAQRAADAKAGFCRMVDNPRWRDCLGPSVTVEADNGQVYRAFTGKGISGRSNLGWQLLVYIEQQPNAPYYPPNMHRFIFDCRGDYEDITSPRPNMQFAPPRSVAGRLSAIACSLPEPNKPAAHSTVPSRNTAPAVAPTVLSASELNLIKQQIEQCWYVPAGARGAQDLTPAFRVSMNSDGTVRSATLLNPERLNDPFFQSAADSARRALFNPRCQPLKLSPQEYNQWQTFTITFDPKDLQ